MLYISLVECFIYFAHITHPKAPGALILVKEGPPVNWLRYAGWLVTTPILIIHMQSLSGVAKLDDRLIQMLIFNQGMILFGITGAVGHGQSRAVAFTLGIFGIVGLFYRAAEIYKKAFKTYPRSARMWLMHSMINFYVPWSCFPVLWLYGPEGAGALGKGEDIIGHCIADLSAKMAWGYITWYLHHVILHSVAARYGMSPEEYSNARAFDVQFGHDLEWTEDDPDSPSTFALEMVFTRRELEESLEVRIVDFGTSPARGGSVRHLLHTFRSSTITHFVDYSRHYLHSLARAPVYRYSASLVSSSSSYYYYPPMTEPDATDDVATAA